MTHLRFFPSHGISQSSTIGIFSPSDSIVGTRAARIEHGIEILKSSGFKTEVATNAFAIQGTRAGTITQRIRDIEDLINSQSVEALVASHGGKACVDLVWNFPWSTLSHNRKPVLGFSDVSVILNAITGTTGQTTFYGPNVLSRFNETRWNNLRSLVRGSGAFCCERLFGNLIKKDCICLRGGVSRGILFGGNLECFIYGLILSGFNLSPFQGGIFFWESSGLTASRAYQILTALKNNGFIDTISGMIIGNAFRGSNEAEAVIDGLHAVRDACTHSNFPILYVPTFGHADLENPIIPIGCYAQLDADLCEIVALEPYVV